MRRTAGDVQVDRKHRVGPVVDLGASFEGPSVDGAGPDGDHDLGIRDRLVGLLQGKFHVLRDGSGNHEPVGMPGRCDELDAEAGEVEDDVVQCLKLQVAPAAAPRADRSQFEGTPKEFSHVLVQRLGQLKLFPC